ncbi:MAG: translocation/assembly module TamB domain-containing protein, partial [Gammaproteobacteria bacterium]
MKRLLTSVLVVTTLVVIGLAFALLATEPGLRLLWSRLQHTLPAGVSMESVSGRVLGPLTVRGFVLEQDSGILRIEVAEIEWMPTALLGGVALIESLQIEGVEYIAIQADSDALEQDQFRLPERIDLGWPLSVRDLRAVKISVDSGAGAGLFEIDELALAGKFGDARLSLERFAARSRDFELDGSGEIQTRDSYPLAAAFRWQAQLAGYPELVGATRFGGSLQDLRIEQTLSAPWELSGVFTLDDIFGELHLEGQVAANDVDLRGLGLDAPMRIMRAEIDIKGALHDLGLRAHTRLDHAALGNVDAGLHGRYRDGTLYLDALEASIPGQPARLIAKGQLDLESSTPTATLTLDWTNLRWPLSGDIRLSSTRGQLELSGAADNYLFSVSGEVELPEYLAAMVDFDGTGNQRSVDLSRIRMALLDGIVEGVGALRWQPEFQAEIAIRGSEINPGARLPRWPGRLNIQANAAARLVEGRLKLELPQIRVDGRLGDYPVELRAGGAYAPGQIDISSFMLHSGDSRAEASGKVGDKLDLTWKIDSPDLGDMVPEAGGSLWASGMAQGSLRQPVLESTIRGEQLRYRGDTATSLSVDSQIDMTGNSRSSLTARLVDGSVAGIEIQQATLTGSGTPGAHQFDFSAVTGRGTAEMTLDGEVQGSAWSYRLTQARLAYADLEPLILKGDATGRIGRDLAELDQSCWVSGDATLCIKAKRAAAGYGAAFTLETLPAAYLASWLPADLLIHSDISGQGQLTVTTGPVTEASLRLRSGPGSVSAVAGDGEILRVLTFDPGEFVLDLSPQGLELSASLPLAEQGGLKAQATVGAGSLPLTERPLSGTLTTDVPDIRILNRLIPELSRIEGHISGSVSVSGTLRQPALTGQIALREATARLDRPGLTLEDLVIELAGQGSGSVLMRLQARSGEGILNVTGTADLLAKPVQLEIKLVGDDLQVLNLPEARLFASPDLALTMQGKRLDLVGQIAVPRGSIEPKQLPTSAVSVSKDQVIVDEPAGRTRASPYELNARVRLLIEDKVKFSGFGLKGRFQGNLLLTDKPGQPTSATGELSILDGTYKAYGQNLQIRTGRLLFAGGPVTEPGIDVEAVRRPEPGVLVGIKGRGALKQPVFSIFSDPAMGESDQLSYLVLGRPMERQTTSAEQSAMNQA